MKKKKNWVRQLGVISIVVLLAACGRVSDGVQQTNLSVWDRLIIYPLSQIIIWLSELFGNYYAIGIIVFTLIIRLLLFPLNKMQLKSQREMQELQPELEKLRANYPNRDRESMMQLRQAEQELMQEKGINQFAGCLPLLIQLPVMMALYQTIIKTEVLKQGHFIWVNLGQPDPYFILPIIAAGLTWLNSYLMMLSNPKANQQVKWMMYLMPIMILVISLNLPSAVTLYWVVSNIISVVQTLIYNNPYKIIEERQQKEQEERQRQKRLNKAMKRARK